MVEKLSREQMNRLSQHPAAVEAICAAASAYVASKWNQPMGIAKNAHDKPNYGVTYWEEAYQNPRGEQGPTWDAVWFDWLLIDDSTAPHSRGGVTCFMGGITGSEGTDLLPGDAGAAWARPLIEQHGFMRFTEGEHERFTRVAYPEQVLEGDTVQEQGESLGAWAVAGFRALRSSWPPPFVRTEADDPQ